MPKWDSKKFEEKAAAIATAASKDADKLHAYTVKAAREEKLNEEQIRRLSRAVNVQAFNQKFASKKSDKDRYVEFTPVSDDSVIDELFRKAPEAEKTASAIYPELPNQMREVRGWGGSNVKVASAPVTDRMADLVQAPPALDKQLNHWVKVSEDLAVKAAGAELAWDSAMNTVKDHSRRIGWNHESFEKDAMALHGSHVLFELNALRTETKREPLGVTKDAADKLNDILFGEDNEDIRLLKSAADARIKFLLVKNAQEKARKEIESLKKRLVG
jgi:hypothetical protein